MFGDGFGRFEGIYWIIDVAIEVIDVMVINMIIKWFVQNGMLLGRWWWLFIYNIWQRSFILLFDMFAIEFRFMLGDVFG